MTDDKIKSVFRHFVRRRLVALLAWSNQRVPLILVPASHSNPIVLNFRPLWPILFLLVVAVIVGTSAIVLSNGARTHLAKATLARELDDSRKALDDVHSQIENMLQLMDRFQNTISLLRSDSNESNIGADYSPQDFIDITAAAGMVGSSNMSDVERLKLLNAAIENSIAPLRKSLSLLANQQQLLIELPTMWPVKNHQGRISFLFGPNLDPILRTRWYLHRGLDIADNPGTPLVAAAGGKVVEVDHSPRAYGNYVVIKHKYGLSTLYAHQQQVFVGLGDIVRQGDIIGLMGATGRVTGPHVHFEIRIGSEVVDPVVYLSMSESNRKSIADYFNHDQRNLTGGRGRW